MYTIILMAIQSGRAYPEFLRPYNEFEMHAKHLWLANNPLKLEFFGIFQLCY